MKNGQTTDEIPWTIGKCIQQRKKKITIRFTVNHKCFSKCSLKNLLFEIECKKMVRESINVDEFITLSVQL